MDYLTTEEDGAVEAAKTIVYDGEAQVEVDTIKEGQRQ